MADIPPPLEFYEPIADLAHWRAEGTPEEKRQWIVHGFPDGSVTCQLLLNIDGLVAQLNRSAPTVHEAVWMCISEFRKHEASRPPPLPPVTP